jgi:hypothetical protein
VVELWNTRDVGRRCILGGLVRIAWQGKRIVGSKPFLTL